MVFSSGDRRSGGVWQSRTEGLPSPARQTGIMQGTTGRLSPTKRESPPVVFSAASAGEARPIREKSGGIRFLREKNAVLLA